MPLKSGAQDETISFNIREMMRAGHPQKQAVAAALAKSRERATGGIVAPTNLQAALSPFGTVTGVTPQATAEAPQVVDTPEPVAVKADPKEMTGTDALFSSLGPLGDFYRNEREKERGVSSRDRTINQRAQGGIVSEGTGQSGGVAAAPIGLIEDPTPGRTDRLPMVVGSDSYVIPADVVSGLGQGNTMAGAEILDQLLQTRPQGMAKGGAAQPDGVEIIAAGGEYVVPPDGVERLGGGDRKKGHQLLDGMVRNIRKQVISHMKALPGPVK